jgi:2-oxoglutarate/2-oxoacid ferredoxin oxidoreductase subunit alpha
MQKEVSAKKAPDKSSHIDEDRRSNAPEELDVTTIRFAGDSGDGMQLLGTRFANTSAVFGEDVMTLAEYPAEIRAPAGTIAGVSGFQLSMGPQDIYTAGDMVDVLVAMNPAALKSNLQFVRKDGILIVNEDTFTDKNLKKVGYMENPLENNDLQGYRVFPVGISRLTATALEPLGVEREQVGRSKNLFALGLICWLFNMPLDNTLNWLKTKFSKKPEVIEANTEALVAGNKYGDSNQLFATSYIIKKPEKKKQPGTYRYLNGNSALSMGLITAAELAGLHLFLGSYPITPASDVLHELSRHKEFPVTTFQAEDEIAAIGAAIGASYAGSLAVTSTSGPGMALKTEFLNLAVSIELPLVIINVQRGGPSTGLPTKMEQSDLFQALWSRPGESPLIILAASSPKDCFDTAIEACRLTLKYMTPVIVLSDGYIANGSEAWRIPSIDELPEMVTKHFTDTENFQPYRRDSKTLARPWAIPGTPGMEHRVGGLEKEDVTGEVDQSPENHEKMVHYRAEKVARVCADIPPLEIEGDKAADLLIVGWGSSYGAVTRAVMNLTNDGVSVASVHIKHLSPLPSDLGGILKSYKRVLVAENNLGQLWTLLRATYLVDAELLSKVSGVPFKISEIENKIRDMVKG